MAAIQQLGAQIRQQYKSLDFFKKIPLFANLLDTEVVRFVDLAQIKTCNKGTFLYHEGERADFFYIICSGWLKLFHITEEGEEVNLAMLTKNEITGESAIFEDGNFTNSAQVVEDSEMLCIPLHVLKDQLHIDTQLAFNMLNSMITYRRHHELELEKYFLYSAPQRIGCFLLGLCPKLEQKDGVMFDLPYDKTLIASVLGMKGATFSRALNILRDETGITISGAHVKIDSIKRLLKFVNGCYSPPHISES